VSRYNPDKHHRRSIRLKGYDYAQAGAYFVTICAQNRECLFGGVVNGRMVLNDAGRMVQTEWEQLRERFPTVELDAHVVMPNHFHAVVIITDSNDAVSVGAGLVPAPDGATTRVAPTGTGGADGYRVAPTTTRVAPTDVDTRHPTLGDIVGAFKSLTTNAYIRGVRELGWPPFDKRLWQRNYYERIVRNEGELNRIRRYIENNPANWETDEENPDRRRRRT
jgi:putative transposase